jgi:hypothetical protein
LTLADERATLTALPESWAKVTQLNSFGEQETSMKISRLCAVALLCILGSALAFADSMTDPKIIIHGASGNGPLNCGPKGCQQVGINFTFTTPVNGKGTLFFTNASGKNWTSLALIETGVPAADISCTQSLFLSCTTETLKNGSVEILLSGVRHGLNPRSGILAGQSFSIGFACVDKSCWPGGATFTGHAGTAPEPGTVALMVTGLGAIISRRKKWMSRLKA